MGNPPDEIDALKAQVAVLIARVNQLELRTGIVQDLPQRTLPPVRELQSTPQPAPETMPQPPSVQIASGSGQGLSAPTSQQSDIHVQPSPQDAPSKADSDIEKTIGEYWLNRIGIVAMLVGVYYFLKYASENHWTGPGGRIVLGLLAGMAVVVWSERFRSRGYVAFSYSLKAIGIGALYLSLWGAFHVYQLIPLVAAFVAMGIVTACAIALAVRQNAEMLALFALIGGFATPVLLSTGQNNEVVLFSYVALVDIAILAMAIVKPWRRLLWGSFVGTIVLSIFWLSTYYSKDQRTVTVCFAGLFAIIFAVIPLATHYPQSMRLPGPSLTLISFPLANAAAFFLALYMMYERETPSLTWFALGMAAVYFAVGGTFKKRWPDEDRNFISYLHVAIAIAFITIAIPLKLEAQWMTIGWLVESGVVFWISVRTQTGFLRYIAVAAMSLGIARLLFFERFHTETLAFNARFAAYAVAIAIMAEIANLGRRHASATEMAFRDMAVIAANLLALIAVTLEASDFFGRQTVAGRNHLTFFRQVPLARDFSFSAIWLIYGAALMAVGFLKRSAFARWQSLILIAFTIGKVFFYDVSQLGGSYRILSFVGLGAVLLLISFIYQRDWLKLSSHPSQKSS